MGLLSNKVDKTQLKPGDHIYTWRTLYTYSHHGIYVGERMVVHFTREPDESSGVGTSIFASSSSVKVPSSCTFPDCGFRQVCTFPDCGFRQENSGVSFSCLDCFLGNGSLYRFEYGVTPSLFLAKFRGGTCTTAPSDHPDTVVHRALHLLQIGFGDYDVFRNNCEDFALYCKTSLLILGKSGAGRSGQASSGPCAPWAALLSSPLKLLMPGYVGVTPSLFLAKFRGGTCTTAPSDPPDTVVHRALHLLQNGFGNYEVLLNNCENFALHCKTALLILDKLGAGRSGQASSVLGVPLAALLSSPLKLVMPGYVGVATVSAGMYCANRYATDIGVRTDVIKVAVEDMAVNLGWTDRPPEESDSDMQDAQESKPLMSGK